MLVVSEPVVAEVASRFATSNVFVTADEVISAPSEVVGDLKFSMNPRLESTSIGKSGPYTIIVGSIGRKIQINNGVKGQLGSPFVLGRRILA